jgi:pimeloyl-ACP methyl ester carboxylesterase
MSERVLTDGRSVVHYYRRGYGERSSLPTPVTIFEHASDLRTLLRELGVRRVHVLGHSIGAAIAIQAALDDPDLVSSLVLVEPVWVSRPALLNAFSEAMAPVLTAYAAGDPARATRLMLQMIDGESYAPTLGAALGPGWFDAAVDALDIYMGSELPATVGWAPDAEQASRLTSPVLVLSGGNSGDLFDEVARDTVAKFPSSRHVRLSHAAHNVIAAQPAASAARINEFLVECDRPA